jgi:hypothetical protein
MNYTRHIQMLGAQTTIAQRVFDCVPASEVWTLADILREYTRVRGGLLIQKDVAEGCLSALIEGGLVKKSSGGYIRAYQVPIPPPPTLHLHKENPVTAQATTEATKKDPLAKLASAADYLRRLANEIDEAALEAQQMIDAAKSEGSGKLESVRAALRGLLR